MASRVEARSVVRGGLLGIWLKKCMAAFAAHRSRRALARLDRRLLDDVGLEWSQAQHEASRRLWDAPDHWFSGRGGPF